MRITREQLRRWGACYYDDERVATLVPAEGLTPLEIAALDIPVEDRMWVLLREELIPARDLRLLACDWAEKACRMAGWNDERSLNAIAVARRFAVGEATEAELAEARSEAWAARCVAWVEVYEARSRALAARSAAEARAEAASASWAASAAWQGGSASWAASARSARALDSGAWAEALAEQLADVVRVLRRIEGGTQAGKEVEE